MLGRFISKNLKYSFIYGRTNLTSSFLYSFNFKNFAKKDKGRLSDSESKRGAKKGQSEDGGETITYSSSNDSFSSNKKQIQSVDGHKVN